MGINGNKKGFIINIKDKIMDSKKIERKLQLLYHDREQLIQDMEEIEIKINMLESQLSITYDKENACLIRSWMGCNE